MIKEIKAIIDALQWQILATSALDGLSTKQQLKVIEAETEILSAIKILRGIVEDKKVYAEKGEVVICTNGHQVFKFKKTIFVEDEEDITLFDFFDDQKAPKRGTEYFQCLCHCGAEYIKQESLFPCYKFHFFGGWR